jgi:aryl-alcohol dehydrogenase-like predicted oxidoreductase
VVTILSHCPAGRRNGQYGPRAVDPPTAADRIPLAGSDVSIPPLGVGTWAWGDKRTWGMGGYDTDLTEATIRDAWQASLDAGVTFFDTAEVYGNGESERIIGQLLAEDPARRSGIVIASKFMPVPWKVNVRTALATAARRSCERLGVESVDLYQLHGPISLRSHGALADALAGAHEEGLVRAVGVSNYSPKETRRVDAALRERGMRLATNQVELSLLRTLPERSGLLRCCAELGVVVLAYSPIGQGRLTGKYSSANPPPASRNFANYSMTTVDGIVDVLRRIGDRHGGRTPSQVALAWLIGKGTVPIPGAKNRRQADENAGALGWALAADEVAELDDLALPGRRGIPQRVWQHG